MNASEIIEKGRIGLVGCGVLLGSFSWGADWLPHLSNSRGCLFAGNLGVGSNVHDSEHMADVSIRRFDSDLAGASGFHQSNLQFILVPPIFERGLDRQIAEQPLRLVVASDALSDKIHEGRGKTSDNRPEESGRGNIQNVLSYWHGLPLFLWVIIGWSAGYVGGTVFLNGMLALWCWSRGKFHSSPNVGDQTRTGVARELSVSLWLALFIFFRSYKREIKVAELSRIRCKNLHITKHDRHISLREF
jgi:hypothetical protein